MTKSDEQLLRQFIEGNEQSFSLLVHRYKRLIFKFVLLKVKDSELAADLTQDVFVRLYHSANSYKFYGKFYSWIMKIAQNICIDYFRKNGSHEIFQSIEASEQESDNLDIHYADETLNEFNPEKKVERNETGFWIKKAIENLPEEQREAIVLCHYHGLTYRQISEIQNCPVGTVKSRVHNALSKLQKYLKSQGLELS